MVDKDYDLMVGLRIRSAREALHLSREKFSEMCGISESFLAAVENGTKGITVKTLYKICSSAHLSPNYVVYGRERGSDRDVALELLGCLNEREQTYALQILSTYVMSVRELEKSGKETKEK